MGFLDVLSDLNRQNFGGGLAEYGKSLADLKQNQDLVKGISDFREKKRLFEDEELKTTSEQLVEIDNKKDEFTGDRSLINKALGASLNLVDTYSKIGAYQDLYQPYIMSFATLGEDGVRIANSLTRELSDKVSLLEKKSTIPLIEQQYKNEVLQSAMDTVKFEEIVKKIKKDERITNIVSWMVDNSLMDLIPGENAKTTSKSFYQQHVHAKKNLLDAARKQFGDVDDDSLGMAFQLALGYAGKSLEFNYDPAYQAYLLNKGAKGGSSDFELSNAKARMQQLDADWQSYDDDKINKWRAYVRQGIVPEGYDKKTFEEMSAKFGPSGEFTILDSYVRLLGDKSWGQTSLKDIEVSFGQDGSELVSQRYPVNGMDASISRIKNPNSFLTGIFDYSVRDNAKVLKAKKDRYHREKGKENLFESGKTDSTFNDILMEMMLSGGLKHPINK